MESDRPSPLPADVVRFLQRRIENMTQLEALLAVHEEPQTPTMVARRIRLTSAHAEQELDRLVARRLVVSGDGTYRLRASPDVVRALVALDRLYPTYRLAIARAIFSG